MLSPNARKLVTLSRGAATAVTPAGWAGFEHPAPTSRSTVLKERSFMPLVLLGPGFEHLDRTAQDARRPAKLARPAGLVVKRPPLVEVAGALDSRHHGLQFTVRIGDEALPDELLDHPPAEPGPIAPILIGVRFHTWGLEGTLGIGREECQPDGARPGLANVRSHVLQRPGDFIPRQQAGLDRHRSPPVVVDHALVDGPAKWRTLQVEMRHELLSPGIPEILSHVALQVIADRPPTYGVRCVLANDFDVVLDGDCEHRVVIDVDRAVGARIQVDVPGSFGLHIAPIRGRRAPDEAVPGVKSLLHHIVERLSQPLPHGPAGNRLVEHGPIAGDADVLANGLNER